MINNSKFADRLKKVMEYYQLSAAAFADEIDVQRSSISHLLSGRNKPSLDFVLKVLSKFNAVDLYWLMNGKGTFPKKEDHSIPPATKPNTIAESQITSSEKEIDRDLGIARDSKTRTVGDP